MGSDRAALILDLVVSGFRWDEIAAVLGMDRREQTVSALRRRHSRLVWRVLLRWNASGPDPHRERRAARTESGDVRLMYCHRTAAQIRKQDARTRRYPIHSCSPAGRLGPFTTAEWLCPQFLLRMLRTATLGERKSCFGARTEPQRLPWSSLLISCGVMPAKVCAIAESGSSDNRIAGTGGLYGFTGCPLIKWATVRSHAGQCAFLCVVFSLSTSQSFGQPVEATQVLERRCQKCHGPERQRGGLRLDSRQAALKGGDSRKPAIVPGQSSASRLIELIRTSDASHRMPFREPALAGEEIALLTRWIDEGARWPQRSASQDERSDSEALATLQKRCVSCHGPASAMAGLRLDTFAAATKGGASGPALVPGNSSASLLMRRVVHKDTAQRMPPGNALAPEEVATLSRWIDSGAPWNPAPTPRESLELQVTEADRRHWAFRPLPKAVPVPDVLNEKWVRTPVDAFIAAAHDKKGVTPVSAASARELIRRATFDLTGLPPDRRAVERFAADTSPAAWDRLVNELLSSPHYGERWGRHWLDVARYADSDGYEADRDRNQAFHYRDFVIRALNRDMPYDEFVRWQLAGDEFAPDNPDAIAATGFIAAGPNIVTAVTDSKTNKERYRYDELDDYVATTGSALLGVTVGCARCHDHKYDPIPTRDYYRMVAAFANSRREVTYLSKPRRDLKDFLDTSRASLRESKMNALGLSEEMKGLLRPALLKNNPTQRKAYEAYDSKLQFTDEEFRSWLGVEGQNRMDVLTAAASNAPPSDMALIVRDLGPHPAEAWLLGRGNPENKREPLVWGGLTVLTGAVTPEQYQSRARTRQPHAPSGYTRAALAEWITDVEHGAGGLLARVIVNRVWQHHFGEGLVRTSGDFGLQGDVPVHTDLLDWLARQLIQNGWSLKSLHAMIMRSSVYQLGSTFNRANAKLDPDNRLLWRRRPVRLEAEALRDAMLAASGKLNLTMFGPGFKPPVPKDAMATRSNDVYPSEAPDTPELYRRSIYMFAKRSVRYPMIETFDGADVNVSCSRRTPTVVPTQALALLNDGWVRARAQDLASRLKAEAGPSADAQVRLGFELLFSRPPDATELRSAVDFLANSSAGGDRLANLCHTLFLLNEFQYVN